MENSFIKQRKFQVALIIIVVLLLAFFFINREKTVIVPASTDGKISWTIPSPGGLDTADTQKRIDDLLKMFSEEKDMANKYEIAVGLSGLYTTLGDGKNALVYLNKAVNVTPERSLAYMNAGDLFSRVYATTSARTYFEMGLSKEPQYEQNHVLYISYLRTSGAPQADIEKAFTEGLERTGRNDNILKEYATWLTGEKRFADAIKIWEEELTRNPNNKNAIQQEIQRLKKK
jgi:Tfp pilus assembly protein PilF